MTTLADKGRSHESVINKSPFRVVRPMPPMGPAASQMAKCSTGSRPDCSATQCLGVGSGVGVGKVVTRVCPDVVVARERDQAVLVPVAPRSTPVLQRIAVAEFNLHVSMIHSNHSMRSGAPESRTGRRQHSGFSMGITRGLYGHP